ncbi:uncharacterized protein LOC135077828 [Ostrinia nubilalis]|uniref:uncharacterized protein LOC135077828 n=1 Tax=Ostrinia nubilalis TaxID=29057 RepID=UPI00308230D8
MSVSDVLFNSEPLLAVNMVFGLVTVCISLYQILVASLVLWQALKTKGNIFLCSLWYVSHLSILTLYFIIFCARAAVCFKERRYLAGTATVVVGVIYEGTFIYFAIVVNSYVHSLDRTHERYF